MNDVYKQHGAFSWSELLVDDIDLAIGFYTDVIGWEIEEMEMPQGKYYIIKSDGTPIGGIMKKPEGIGKIAGTTDGPIISQWQELIPK